MQEKLYNALKGQVNESQNLEHLKSWCSRQSQMIHNFGGHEQLYQAALRDAFESIGKGLHLK